MKGFLSSFLFLPSSQDLANQILLSTRYQDAIKEHGVAAGRFVSVRAAEFLSGLPAGWTSPHAGAVKPGSWKCEASMQYMHA